MKVGLYFCTCGTNITATVDSDKVIAELTAQFPESYASKVEFICSAEGKSFFKDDLLTHRPDRVVIAACSPREYENTFMQILAEAGINPYFMQFVNIREQVAWVTPDPAEATQKATVAIRSAMARVCLQLPLEKKELEANGDVLVVGAGPAGLQAALFLAEGGRKVVLVEKSPAIGGMPVFFEELFPTMECGPCLLEPFEEQVLHGDYAHNIELLLLSEVTAVTGYYGNFNATIRQAPRYVGHTCIGCGMCVEVCPASASNPFNCGMDEKKAIAMPFLGALPNFPYIDPQACIRTSGGDCQLCLDACPMPETVLLDDKERIVERKIGAIILAIGSKLYDCSKLTGLGYGEVPGVFTSLEFERLASSNGPTGGEIKTAAGSAPGSVAIIHCVGSLDAKHQPHCSGICCEYAFKFNRILEHKLPGTKVYHLYKEMVVAGKSDFTMLEHAQKNPHASFIRYKDITEIKITAAPDGQKIAYRGANGQEESFTTEMVVLCPAMVGSDDAAKLGEMMDLSRGPAGFFDDLNGRLHNAQSKVKGVYLAGTCQAPMDIGQATGRAMAAAGYVLSGLAAGKKLVIEPISAEVDEERCSGCRICGNVCPYKAISFIPESETSRVNALLCHGCGTCVAACPAGAIQGNHFTNDQILAEIEAILQ
ncbi:MAG: CoB--CoM heterodisulfide reductase iron-sulfur subunit A family protein [Terracidiphilus sp.]